MTEFVRRIRIALRGLGRTPTFTIAATLILGLGIGTSVAMFTVFRAVLLERLPVRDADRVLVLSTYRDPAFEYGLLLPDLKLFRQESRTLRDIAGYAHWGAIPSPLADGDRSIVLQRTLASGNFFDVLGARPALGRLLRADDELPGAAHVMVLSYKAWRKEFNGDPGIVGKRLLEPYTQVQYTVVGVAPAGLEYPASVQTWSPATTDVVNLSIIAIGRLADGASAAAAREEILAIKQRISPTLHIVGARAVPFSQAAIGDVKPVLVVLSAAVGLLLLIACVNVGNLLLLRTSARARELAIRRALGATYGDVVRQLMLESGLLAAGGGVVGLLSGQLLLRVLLAFSPAQLPRTDVIQLAGAPIAGAIGVTLIAVILFGVVPAFLAARSDVASTLRFDSRSGRDSASRRRARHLLVGAQTMLALIMLAGSILLARSLAKLEGIDLGYEASHLSILGASWPVAKYDGPAKLFPVGDEIMGRWRSVPGVTAVTPIMIPPLNGANVFLGRLEKEGQSAAEREAAPNIPVEAGGKDYFKVFGIPLRSGRRFEDSDDERAPYVAVVSEGLARRLWPGENPIGKRINYWSADTGTKWRTIIGVAADAHLRLLREPTQTVYIPWRQSNFWQVTLAIRTSGSLASVLPALRREMAVVEPQLSMWYAKSMDELLAAPLAQPRTSALLMSSFGVAALLLAAIGLYGLMASVVRERTREIGIRMALGAAPARVRRDVIGQALTVAGAGAALGLAGAFATSRLLTNVLYGVSPTDPIALSAACGVLLLVVLAAAYLPARRATKIDPSTALRAE